jgi:hypothetical protein
MRSLSLLLRSQTLESFLILLFLSHPQPICHQFMLNLTPSHPFQDYLVQATDMFYLGYLNSLLTCLSAFTHNPALRTVVLSQCSNQSNRAKKKSLKTLVSFLTHFKSQSLYRSLLTSFYRLICKTSFYFLIIFVYYSSLIPGPVLFLEEQALGPSHLLFPLLGMLSPQIIVYLIS